MINLLNQFDNHVYKYDMDDTKIKLKYYHSYRVMQLCREIAESEKLNEEDTYLATVIGLLHDYARFEQWDKYKTFSDINSIDHGDLGVQLLFDRSVGWGENSKRLEHISSSCGFSHTSRKLYPYFIQSGTLTPGTYFDGLAVRVPLYKYDGDLTSVGWYWVEDSIVLTIDTHKALNKDIVLPNYMNNRRVEVLDKTDSCVCNQTYIFNNKLRFICTSDYGYLVLKLSK